MTCIAPDAFLLPYLYATEQTDGWSVGMRRVTRSLLQRTALPDGPLVDLGCGGGILVTELREQDHQAWGVDLHPCALARGAARGNPPPFVRADIMQLPWPEASVGILLALDTFDQSNVHVGRALQEAQRVLYSGGLLVVRVSAHPRLQGPHDAAFNTGRRHTKRAFHGHIRSAGFEIVEMTYANSVTGIPAALLRLLQRHQPATFSPGLYRNRAINLLLRRCISLEAGWLARFNLPAGLSLYVIARKNDD